MIRASHFCRSSQQEEFNVQIVVQHSEPQVSLVSWKVLRRLSRLSGSLVSLSCPAQKTCIYTRLVLAEDEMNEHDDADDEFIDDKDVVIRVNVLTAFNLLLGLPINKDSTCILKTLSSNDEEIPPPKSVTLRIWGIPVPPPSMSPSPPKENFPLPARKTLLQNDILIPVRQGDQVYIYEVIHIDGGKGSNVYEPSSETSFRIEAAERKTSCPRLPPITAVQDLFSKDTTALPPHPDTSVLVEALSLSSHTTASERVLHLCGETKNVTEAIQVAADCLGRRLIKVRGLAFHAYLHGRTQNPTGSLVDKLHGLEVALEQAFYHAPAVLLLQNLDKELSLQDRDLQEDEESRLWSLLMDYLRPSSHQYVWNGKLPSTPPPGPLKHNMVHPSIACSNPNVEYVEYLWKQYIKDVPATGSRCEILSGRSREQVCRILEGLNVHIKTSPDSTDLDTFLSDLCEKHDNKSKLSSMAKIPKVHYGSDRIASATSPPLSAFDAVRNSFVRASWYGKTLVAKAVATEFKLPFLSVKGPELLGSYIGESEANVRDPPACILFFDELDSLAPRRGDQASGGNVMDRVVSTFFGELDKDTKDCSLFVLGATNRPDLLDPSLLRPGRFDRLVYLGIFPEDRASILAAQIRNLNLEDEPHVLADLVVKKLPENLTGADLSTIATGAQLIATERLCLEAENELRMQHENVNNDLTMDELLESWSEERLVPTVTLADLMQASAKVMPSVSEADLTRYERLKDQFRR